MQSVLQKVSLASIIAIPLALVPVTAMADEVRVNFENPPYTLGTINLQNGWSSFGAVGLGCAMYDHAVSSSFGTRGFGAQSLRISNTVVSGCFGDQTFGTPLVNAVGETTSTSATYSKGTLQSHFETQFSLASVVPNAQQPGLYMSVSPDRGDGSRMSYLRFEDQTDGIHVFFIDVTDPTHAVDGDTFNETDISTLTRAPHVIKLTLDAVNGPDNDVVKVYIDGKLAITGTSWEDYYRYDSEASAEQSPRIVKTVLFRTGGIPGVDNAPATLGKGFLVDNLSYTSGAKKDTDGDDDKKGDKDHDHDKDNHKDHDGKKKNHGKDR